MLLLQQCFHSYPWNGAAKHFQWKKVSDDIVKHGCLLEFLAAYLKKVSWAPSFTISSRWKLKSRALIFLQEKRSRRKRRPRSKRRLPFRDAHILAFLRAFGVRSKGRRARPRLRRAMTRQRKRRRGLRQKSGRSVVPRRRRASGNTFGKIKWRLIISVQLCGTTQNRLRDDPRRRVEREDDGRSLR